MKNHHQLFTSLKIILHRLHHLIHSKKTISWIIGSCFGTFVMFILFVLAHKFKQRRTDQHQVMMEIHCNLEAKIVQVLVLHFLDYCANGFNIIQHFRNTKRNVGRIRKRMLIHSGDKRFVKSGSKTKKSESFKD